MKFRLQVWLGLLFFTGSLFANTNSIFSILQSQPSATVVFYGTSLTAESVWPNVLIQELEKKTESKIKLINSAMSGQNSKWGALNLQSRVISKLPNIVFIEFAINDAHRRYKLSTNDTKRNFNFMILQIKRQLPKCQIVLMTMSDAKGVAESNRQYKIADYYQSVVDVAHLHQVMLIDLYPNWIRLRQQNQMLYDQYMPDGLHPTDIAAKEFIAPAILEQLQND
ncbi:MAG: SGNH/GDSL hydrolase family protein [Leptonema sp. (in: Bacteria)]|nr:SGNH/GDSL hydrolase family protein [Leptonema sp. (in: bacteria)]